MRQYDRQVKIVYKLRGSMIEKSLLENNGKFECPICRLWVKNMLLHFNKNPCINKIDVNHFETSFNHYKKLQTQRCNKEKKERMKMKNPELFRLKNLQDVKRYQDRQKEQNPKEFQKKNLENVINSQKKKKEENSKDFQIKIDQMFRNHKEN